MRRAVLACALACTLAVPTAALAAPPAPTAPTAPLARATGTITLIGPSSFTIQTAGRPRGMINALTAAANGVTQASYPYVWGGGHAEAGVPSKGSKGPGHNGHRVGYDCSGAVAAVLAGAGLWPAGSSVPNDAWVIKQLLQEGLIARGAGQAPDEVTLYDDPGVHIFMNIDGRFFGTSDGAGGGNPKDGAGWLDDGAPDAGSRAFRRYHVLPSVLMDRTTYGHSITFQTGANPGIVGGFALGDDVHVSYSEATSGIMVPSLVAWVGAIATTGTVTEIAPDTSSFTVQSAQGAVTFSTGANPGLAGGLQIGETITVTTTKAAPTLARAVTATLAPVTPTPTGVPTAGPIAPPTGVPTAG